MSIISILILFYFAVYPLGVLGNLKSIGEVNIYAADLLAGLIVMAWFLIKLVKKEKFITPPLAKSIIAFVVVAGFSLFLNSFKLRGNEILIAGLYLVRWAAYAGLYFVFSEGKSGKFGLKKILLFLGGVIAVFGFVQYIFWPDIKPLEIYGWDPHYFRLVSTFLDPGFTGIILTLSLILLLGTWEKLKGRMKWGAWILIYGALSLTYSRASYLAYLVGMTIIAIKKRSVKFFCLILFLGIVTLLILPKPQGEGSKLMRLYSIQTRIENWRHTLIIAKDHLLTGVGFNAYRYAQRDYGFLDDENERIVHSGAGADSSLLFVLATTGILGLAAYLWIWKEALNMIHMAGLKDRESGAIIHASMGAVFTHSLFLNSLFYPWVMAWIWMLLTFKFKVNK